jgi:hypothetical protein
MNSYKNQISNHVNFFVIPGVVTKPYFFDNSNIIFWLSFNPEPISKNKAHIFSYEINILMSACFSNKALVSFSLNPHPTFSRTFLNLSKSTTPLSYISKNLKAVEDLIPSSFLI